MGTHSRAGVDKRLGGRNPEDYHVNGISSATHNTRNGAGDESEGSARRRYRVQLGGRD